MLNVDSRGLGGLPVAKIAAISRHAGACGISTPELSSDQESYSTRQTISYYSLYTSKLPRYSARRSCVLDLSNGCCTLSDGGTAIVVRPSLSSTKLSDG